MAEANEQDKHILLHSCCGPCTLYPLRTLREEGYAVTGYFYNPNIHPFREFAARVSSYKQMAQSEGLHTEIDETYGLSVFLRNLTQAEGDTEGLYEKKSQARCLLCYRSRLESAAEACLRVGMEIFTTSLLVSPYQDHAAIRAVGEDVAAARGLSFLYRDFREGFREGQAMARAAGLYMQGYCGCVFSEYARYGGAG